MKNQNEYHYAIYLQDPRLDLEPLKNLLKVISTDFDYKAFYFEDLSLDAKLIVEKIINSAIVDYTSEWLEIDNFRFNKKFDDYIRSKRKNKFSNYEKIESGKGQNVDFSIFVPLCFLDRALSEYQEIKGISELDLEYCEIEAYVSVNTRWGEVEPLDYRYYFEIPLTEFYERIIIDRDHNDFDLIKEMTEEILFADDPFMETCLFHFEHTEDVKIHNSLYKYKKSV